MAKSFSDPEQLLFWYKGRNITAYVQWSGHAYSHMLNYKGLKIAKLIGYWQKCHIMPTTTGTLQSWFPAKNNNILFIIFGESIFFVGH